MFKLSSLVIGVGRVHHNNGQDLRCRREENQLKTRMHVFTASFSEFRGNVTSCFKNLDFSSRTDANLGLVVKIMLCPLYSFVRAVFPQQEEKKLR